jgi:hypothetical protein
MIVTALIWIYCLTLAWLSGWVTLRALAWLGGIRRVALPEFSVVALVGLAYLSTTASLLALFSNLDLAAHLALIQVPLFVALWWRDELLAVVRSEQARLRKLHPTVLGLALLAGLMTLERTVPPPINFDTGFYHAQSIRWLEEYGVVPGVGSINGQFAVSQAWFALSALFSFSFLKLRSFHVLDGLVFLLFLLYALGGLQMWHSGERHVSILARIGLAALGYELMSKWFSSPTPDIPVALLFWMVGLLLLEKVEQGTLGQVDLHSVSIALLSAYTVAVKLSALPLALLVLVLFWRERRGWRQLLGASAAAALILVPTFLFSIRTTGYLLFPSPYPDLFSFDWKVPYRLIDAAHQYTLSMARVRHRSPNELLAMSPLDWVPIWWSRFPEIERGALAFSLALTAVALPALALGLLSGKLPRSSLLDRALLLGGIYAALLFWFFTAPEARFAWGSLLLLTLLLAGHALQPLFTRLPRPTLAVLLALFLVVSIQQDYLSAPNLPDRLVRYALLPADYPPANTQELQAVNFRLTRPQAGVQCFYAPLPCAPRNVTHIEMRDRTLKDGFRVAAPKGD